jgi:hypothetical protein
LREILQYASVEAATLVDLKEGPGVNLKEAFFLLLRRHGTVDDPLDEARVRGNSRHDAR